MGCDNYFGKIGNLINKCKDVFVPFKGCQGVREQRKIGKDCLIGSDVREVSGARKEGILRTDKYKYDNAEHGQFEKREEKRQNLFCDDKVDGFNEDDRSIKGLFRNVTSEQDMSDSTRRCDSRVADKILKITESKKIGNSKTDIHCETRIQRVCKRIKRTASKKIGYFTVNKCLDKESDNVNDIISSHGSIDSDTGTTKQFLKNILDSAFLGIEKRLKIQRDDSETCVSNKSSRSRSGSRHRIKNVHSRESLHGFGKKSQNCGTNTLTNDFSNIQVCHNAHCPLARRW
ncbi:uncharacterized protein LOC112494038 isoform X2 [Cephus cinctus]|nr:uncharacterized protein LOC112494038 isoform X2 [Cephus cinctus]